MVARALLCDCLGCSGWLLGHCYVIVWGALGGCYVVAWCGLGSC